MHVRSVFLKIISHIKFSWATRSQNGGNSLSMDRRVRKKCHIWGNIPPIKFKVNARVFCFFLI